LKQRRNRFSGIDISKPGILTGYFKQDATQEIDIFLRRSGTGGDGVVDLQRVFGKNENVVNHIATIMWSSLDSGEQEMKMLLSAEDWVKPCRNISRLNAVANTLDACLRQ
jgi:hypothetical protein